MRRHYSEAEKAEVLARLTSNGGNLSRTSRESRVPRKTIERWAEDPERAAPTEVRKEKEQDLLNLWEEVERVLLAATVRKCEAGTLRDTVSQLMVGAGIARDKIQLLTGGATAREETRTLALEWPEYRDNGDGKIVPIASSRAGGSSGGAGNPSR